MDKRLQRDFAENVNRQFKNALHGLVPAKLIPVLIELSGIDPEKKVHSCFIYLSGIQLLAVSIRGPLTP